MSNESLEPLGVVGFGGRMVWSNIATLGRFCFWSSHVGQPFCMCPASWDLTFLSVLLWLPNKLLRAIFSKPKRERERCFCLNVYLLVIAGVSFKIMKLVYVVAGKKNSYQHPATETPRLPDMNRGISEGHGMNKNVSPTCCKDVTIIVKIYIEMY